MNEVTPEVETVTVVKEPRISLTMISKYLVASEKRKISILRGCKYPSGYIPRYYEMARSLACDLFSTNISDQQDFYFQEFSRQARLYREEAKQFPANKDNFKNRIYSANALDFLASMSLSLQPLLNQYVLHSHLRHRKDSIVVNSVRLGAMADMLLYDQYGISQVGLLKFNFSATPLKKEEAVAKLYVLNQFFVNRGVNLDSKDCILIDVLAKRIYTLTIVGAAKASLHVATQEIGDCWTRI